MKKVAAILILCLLFSVPAFADVDLSGMTFDELVSMRQDIDMAIWASDGWQEVEVPRGHYTIGVDIPAGRWSVKSKSDLGAINVFASKEAFDKDPMFGYKYAENIKTDEICNIEVSDGEYLVVAYDAAIFMPYTGATFSFK